MEWYDWILTIIGGIIIAVVSGILLKMRKLNIKIEKNGPHAEGDYIIYNYEDRDVTFEEYGMKTRRKLIISKKKYYPYTTFLILFRIKKLFFVNRIKENINQKIKPGDIMKVKINPEEFKESDQLSGKWRFYIKINGKKYYSKKHKKGAHVGRIT